MAKLTDKQARKIKTELRDFSFVLPSIIIFTIIIIIPLIKGLGYVVTDWNGMTPTSNFVGLDNFKKLFTDKSLKAPILNTFYFTAVTTILINVIGLGLAMLVEHEFRGINVIKSIIFIPLVVSLVLVSYMWMYVYNDFFSLFGWSSPLVSKKTVMLGICAMAIWKEVGLAMMIYLAALKGVSQDYYEAATIDGANFWQKFKSVTVPMIAPAFTYCVPLWLAGGLRMYDYAYVATAGGPNHASESMAYFIYQYLFPFNKVGYGQTVAVVYLIFCIVLSNIVTRLLRKREVEL